IAAEPGTQRRPPTADFTIPWRVAALEPQVSLAIQLVLQVMSESVIRRIVAGAAERAVASAPHCLPVDHHRVPLASVCAVITPACRQHVWPPVWWNRLRQPSVLYDQGQQKQRGLLDTERTTARRAARYLPAGTATALLAASPEKKRCVESARRRDSYAIARRARETPTASCAATGPSQRAASAATADGCGLTSRATPSPSLPSNPSDSGRNSRANSSRAKMLTCSSATPPSALSVSRKPKRLRRCARVRRTSLSTPT